MLHRCRPAVALAATALVLLPASASAARPGDGMVASLFPRAAALCAAVAVGHPPGALAGSPSRAGAACAALKSTVDSANAQFASVASPLEVQMRSIVAAAAATCAAGDRAACAAARRDARQALRPLQEQWRAAARQRRLALETARRTFWTTIRGLVGTTDPAPVVTDPAPPPPPDPIGIT